MQLSSSSFSFFLVLFSFCVIRDVHMMVFGLHGGTTSKGIRGRDLGPFTTTIIKKKKKESEEEIH